MKVKAVESDGSEQSYYPVVGAGWVNQQTGNLNIKVDIGGKTYLMYINRKRST